MPTNKVLFITLSNIGDVILTLPCLDILKTIYPQAEFTVMVGPRPKEIFKDNPNIKELIIYDKHSPLIEKIKLFNQLKKQRFDMVIDLRNTFFGAFLFAYYKTSPFLVIPEHIKHMKDRHLFKLQTPNSQLPTSKIQKGTLYIKPEDEAYIKEILKQHNISETDKIIVVSPGARSHIKRWDKEGFLKVCQSLIQEDKAKIVLVGDIADLPIAEYIAKGIRDNLVNLCAKTTITQLASLFKKALLLITNDSAVLHLGSYLNVPIVAIFGPTAEEKYGPWSEKSCVVAKNISCRPCEKAQCRFGHLKCMKLIRHDDVLRAVKEILSMSQEPCLSLPVRQAGGRQARAKSFKSSFKRILIVRTDRIGDVLLSTPVIKVLRESYPNAYIAMMVSPYAKDIVEGNPYLDDVIIYDKDIRHKSVFSSIKFALKLKKKRFNLALVLHPTNRVHLVTFFAGIPKRVGYDRKIGFLLTDRIKHTKQLGEKHELEYSLDLVRYLGIEPKDKSLFMPIKESSEKWAEGLFSELEIKDNDKLLAIHPGASCPSKIWPAERFAQVCDKLSEKYGFKVLVIAGPKDVKLAEIVAKNMHHPVINLAGKTSVSQLASALKRCHLFISNDSGPVHIASAVGTPVISIFGRNQKGLSPTRWGPTGKNDRVLHKEVGCIECLAHNCQKDFACLKAITVEDVLNTVESMELF